MGVGTKAHRTPQNSLIRFLSSQAPAQRGLFIWKHSGKKIQKIQLDCEYILC